VKYIGVKDCSIVLTTNAPVNMLDFLRRVKLKDGSIVIANGNDWLIENDNTIKLISSNIDYGKKYTIFVEASDKDPIYCLDDTQSITQNFEFTFETEPKFSIQAIRVLNPNAYEVVLTHPIKKGTKLTPNNFLLK